MSGVTDRTGLLSLMSPGVVSLSPLPEYTCTIAEYTCTIPQYTCTISCAGCKWVCGCCLLVTNFVKAAQMCFLHEVKPQRQLLTRLRTDIPNSLDRPTLRRNENYNMKQRRSWKRREAKKRPKVVMINSLASRRLKHLLLELIYSTVLRKKSCETNVTWQWLYDKVCRLSFNVVSRYLDGRPVRHFHIITEFQIC